MTAEKLISIYGSCDEEEINCSVGEYHLCDVVIGESGVIDLEIIRDNDTTIFIKSLVKELKKQKQLPLKITGELLRNVKPNNSNYITAVKQHLIKNTALKCDIVWIVPFKPLCL
ncbi:hypothetical protein [Candidatus Uabimicrobium sp. HlEnr_7]|uniref:hypothetical protein n=1 Tax=Candidatus Uabimicrobium helgolandensis TaxID=3095367 RepID=UPI00355679C0